VTDAAGRGKPIPVFARWLIFLFSGLAAAGYLIVSRGWRGLGLAVALVVSWCILSYATACVVALIVFVSAG
jgi:hypothetical protein